MPKETKKYVTFLVDMYHNSKKVGPKFTKDLAIEVTPEEFKTFIKKRCAKAAKDPNAETKKAETAKAEG